MSEYYLVFDVNLNLPIALAKTQNGRVYDIDSFKNIDSPSLKSS